MSTVADANEGLVSEWRRAAAARVSKITAGPGELLSLGPGRRADGRLRETSGAPGFSRLQISV